MLYDVDIEASACVLSSRYAMLCYASTCVHSDNQIRTDPVCYGFAEDIRKWTRPANQSADWPYGRVYVGF